MTLAGAENVRAVIALNPALDLTAMDPGSKSVAGFLGAPCASVPELCREASPHFRISAGAAPFYIMHGTADQTVPYAQATAMTAKLKAAGVTAELFTAEDGPHTFWANPRWTPRVLQELERFLREQLR